MCGPAAVAGITIASTLYQASQQAKAADAHNRQLENNYNAQMGQLQVQRNQMSQQQAQEESDIAKRAREEAARIAVIAGENGAMGGVYDRLQQANTFTKGDAITQSQRNLDNQMVQTQMEAEGLRSQVRAGAMVGPTWTGVGLQIAGQAADGYAKHKSYEMALKKTQ